jgi:hypothetical protein
MHTASKLAAAVAIWALCSAQSCETTTTTTPASTTTTAPVATTTSTTAAPPTTTLPSGAVYRLGPTGSWSSAVAQLRPGDTLVVEDGTYTRPTSGLPDIDCATAGARSGEPSRPITVIAEHERQAWLKGDGRDALTISNCAWWNIEGLRASNVDSTSAKSYEGNLLRLVNVDHVNVRRVLAVRPNRTCPGSSGYCNVHGIAIEDSRDVLVEECEVYDFHRHGVSAFTSRRVTVRRCYMNPWGATGGAGGGSTGVILYGSSDSIVENVVGEGVYGFNIAGGTLYDGTPGGYRNQILGVVALDTTYGTTIRARKFGTGPVLPAGDNVVRDSVYVRPKNVGVFARGASNTRIENVTVYGAGADAVAVDEDLSEGAPCSANPQGCSATIVNLLAFKSAGAGVRISSVVSPWSLSYSDLWSNGASSAAGDHLLSVEPSGMGPTSCLAWVPDGSNMKGAGAGGARIGGAALRRYQDGVLTAAPLWDQATGRFPCGATVAGVNDDPSRSCVGVHARLNIPAGCAFPG